MPRPRPLAQTRHPIVGRAIKHLSHGRIASGIGGTFLGEALFRMASLLLEGGDPPGFWRELGATVLSPPTGFNRLVFGDRFTSVFPSRDPAIFMRLRFGATLTTHITNADVSNDVIRRMLLEAAATAECNPDEEKPHHKGDGDESSKTNQLRLARTPAPGPPGANMDCPASGPLAMTRGIGGCSPSCRGRWRRGNFQTG